MVQEDERAAVSGLVALPLIAGMAAREGMAAAPSGVPTVRDRSLIGLA